MENVKILVDAIMTDLSADVENTNNTLCKILDMLTDENGNALSYISEKLVLDLQDAAYGVYTIVDLINSEKDAIIYEIENSKGAK